MAGYPHAKLGALISEGRRRAGLQQGELAAALGVSQQAVSRWESGASRPRARQLAAVAAAIRTDKAALRKAGRYQEAAAAPSSTTATIVTSLDQPFPVDALGPESFERFVEYVLRRLYRDAREVRRIGKAGHAQRGVDILVIQRDGRWHTFQCKRVARFGPADLKEAVRRHTESATRKHLVLSRVASPQTAAAMRRFEDWELWDKEDIAHLIRTKLSTQDQIHLVDTFFPGQRLALLGVPSPGAWQSPEQFFAPFEGKLATFSHDWTLIGRSAEAAKIVAELTAGENRIVLLSGAGGAGKSRLLKEVALKLRTEAPGLAPLFLSPTEQLTAQSLDALGNQSRVLIVDDAHERSDLPGLFAFAASRDVRTLIATRPYAKARLRAEAGKFAMGGAVSEIELGPLTLQQTTALARAVLDQFGGKHAFAEPIARATQDCPLVTVIAARIAVLEELPLNQVQNSQSFRDTILGKFAKIITGELAPPGEQKQFTDVLKVISLVQPFSIDDFGFRSLVAQVTGLDDDVVSSTLRMLIEGGIIFWRGSQYRLMPDLLGDYIIEQTCIGAEDRLTSFADKVFTAAPRPLLGHVLVNLGRLDWRRNGGDPSKSHLLDHLWRALKVTASHHDAALEAAAAAAFYQPRQAINFVAEQSRNGLVHDELPKILKHASFNLEFMTEACELLWEIGRGDGRELARHPNHAIGILTELCAVEPDKPIRYNEKVVEFGLHLMENERSFDSRFTPFDFLNGILSGGGHTTEGDSRTITFKPFAVNYDAVDKLRERVIRAAIHHLQSGSLRVAATAAKFLDGALRYPMLPFNARVAEETLGKYTAEFLKTLTELKELVGTRKLDPVVMIAVAHAVSWHANYAERGTGDLARAIIASLPTSLEFRTLCMLVDGFGRIFVGRLDPNTWQTRVNKWTAELVADLTKAYPTASELRRFLEACLERLVASQLSGTGSANILIHEILSKRVDLAAEVAELALQKSGGHLSKHLGAALFFVFRSDEESGRRWARRFLDTGDATFQVAVGQAYSRPRLNDGVIAPEDREILIRVLGSSNRSVVRSGLDAIGALASQSPKLALDLLRHTNLKLDPNLADDALMFLHVNQNEVIEALDEDDARFLLSELKSLGELDGYWVETLLSQLSLRFPELTCAFFLERADVAAANDENFLRYRPINYGPWIHVPLQFKQAPQYRAVLERVWEWLKVRDGSDWRTEHIAASVFEGMFLPVDDQIVAFLSAKLATATKEELTWIASVLSHANADFVFDHEPLVVSFLDACERTGQPIRRKGIDSLLRAAISGVRSGRPGQPFSRDLATVERVDALLPSLPRLSPAYELYDLIRERAERGIELQQQTAELPDDD